MPTAGSLRKMVINGISYDVAADADISHVFTTFEVSRVPSSGVSMKKMVKRVPTAENFVLLTSGSEREQLKEFSEQIADVPITYTDAAGNEYTCEGSFNIDNNTTQENRTTIIVQPDLDWTAFLVE